MALQVFERGVEDDRRRDGSELWQQSQQLAGDFAMLRRTIGVQKLFVFRKWDSEQTQSLAFYGGRVGLWQNVWKAVADFQDADVEIHCLAKLRDQLQVQLLQLFFEGLLLGVVGGFFQLAIQLQELRLKLRGVRCEFHEFGMCTFGDKVIGLRAGMTDHHNTQVLSQPFDRQDHRA